MRHFNNIAIPFSDDTIQRARAGYCAMISEADEYGDKLWAAPEETGQLEYTIFGYSSDHGECIRDHGLWSKNNLIDVAAHVPLIMAGFGIPAGVKVKMPVSHMDLVRTFLAWGGVGGPSTLRDHSLVPLFVGERGDHPGWAYCECHCEGSCTETFMIREGDWKYIHLSWYPGLLFNIAEDPGEKRNLIDDSAAHTVRNRLEGILRDQVDPEALTERAFHAQSKHMKRFVLGPSDPDLIAAFSSRLGKGQAIGLLNAYFGRRLKWHRQGQATA